MLTIHIGLTIAPEGKYLFNLNNRATKNHKKGQVKQSCLITLIVLNG
jgi:hypothetical protein